MKHSHRHSHLHKPKKINLPFALIEETVDKDFRPEKGQEYMIEHLYDTSNKEDSNILIGKFSEVWYGFNFHWYWSASSLQLSTQDYSDDYKNFKRIWKLIRLTDEVELEANDFLTAEDMKLL